VGRHGIITVFYRYNIWYEITISHFRKIIKKSAVTNSYLLTD